MNSYILLIALANVATLISGGVLAVLAHRAFRRTRVDALRVTTIGFGCVVVGAGGGGVLYALGKPLMEGILFQSVCTATGMSVLVYSLYRTPEASTVSQSTG
jgi:hypothetical protein